LADTVYECQIQQKAADGGWIPEVVVVAQADGEDTAVVYDPIIEYYLEAPVEAKIDTDNAKRVTYSWEVKAKSNSNQYTRMKYRLTVMKADHTASMSAVPQGYADVFTASGKCKLGEAKTGKKKKG
jgi:hypothetical protein